MYESSSERRKSGYESKSAVFLSFLPPSFLSPPPPPTSSEGLDLVTPLAEVGENRQTNLIMLGPVRRCREGGGGGSDTLGTNTEQMLRGSAMQRLSQTMQKKHTHSGGSWSSYKAQLTKTLLTIHKVGNAKHPTVFSGLANEKQSVSCVKDTCV